MENIYRRLVFNWLVSCFEYMNITYLLNEWEQSVYFIYHIHNFIKKNSAVRKIPSALKNGNFRPLRSVAQRKLFINSAIMSEI